MIHPQEVCRTFVDLKGLALWQARHSLVLDFIEKQNVKTLVDVGCNEGTLLQKVGRGCQVQTAIGIDIDKEALKIAERNVAPQILQRQLTTERDYDQIIELFRVSGLERYSWLRGKNIDLVSLVEVIEHIYEKDHAQLNDNIFDFLRPKYVIITTPNFQFNVLFANPQDRKYRHEDHKFEWTRQEFHDYCLNINQKYSYTFEIGGLGKLKKQVEEDKGFCTQYAIFTRADKTGPQVQVQEQESTLEENEGPEPFCRFVNRCWRGQVNHLILSEVRKVLTTANNGVGAVKWKKLVEILKTKSIFKRLMKEKLVQGSEEQIQSCVRKVIKQCQQVYNSDKQVRYDKIGVYFYDGTDRQCISAEEEQLTLHF